MEVQGEISGWLTTHTEGSSQAGLRAIPAIGVSVDAGRQFLLDGELSVQATVRHAVQWTRDPNSRAALKPYRVWARVSSPQWELRLGLQHISFGSATLLRPLMWFDRIDPRDPTQNTAGVWGLLGRYYFLGNTTLWLWGLYGNTQRKGLESTPTTVGTPELGGRMQVPLAAGELALTYHQRSSDWSRLVPSSETLLSDRIAEQRIALDGKWDVGTGIWFETSCQRTQTPMRAQQSTTLTTVGADYTFNIGNGLHAVGEYLYGVVGERAYGSGATTSVGVCSFSYPIGILDNVVVMLYRDSWNVAWYRFAFWQRRTDDWTVNLMAFWNPEHLALLAAQQEQGMFGGKGLQLMIVFNY